MPVAPLDRFWSVQQAEAALPEVECMLRDCRELLSGMHSLRDHLEDLHIVHGEALRDPASPAHAEHQELQRQYVAQHARFKEAVERFGHQGVVLKDIRAGIVDFLTLRGQEPVQLCWREGETRILAWHPVDQGFAARRPLPDLETLEAAGRA